MFQVRSEMRGRAHEVQEWDSIYLNIAKKKKKRLLETYEQGGKKKVHFSSFPWTLIISNIQKIFQASSINRMIYNEALNVTA